MNAIITGVSSGIGFELVKRLLTDDTMYKVVGIGRRADRLQTLVDFAHERGVPDLFVPIASDVMDVTLDAIQKHMDHVDILVNNAGLLRNAPFAQLTDADFVDVYRTNVFAPARLIREVLPLMGGERTTHIVNMGSMGGFQGSSKFPGLAAYSSSKSALAGLTECLAEEFKDCNIKVNCLAIGAVQTEMLAMAFPGFNALVTAMDMAEYVADFARNAHRYYNGKVLPVSCTIP
ncbi:MAG: SDR family oxidoreductase [Flavobacteriales bacterium]|nr:SDR family oxidoreductase [Flavobacteriales bacterium]